MMYAIVNGFGNNKLYLTDVKRSRAAIWDVDGEGRTVMIPGNKVRRRPENENCYHVTGSYKPDIASARKFRTREAAEKLIEENPVLRFCRVEEVSV